MSLRKPQKKATDSHQLGGGHRQLRSERARRGPEPAHRLSPVLAEAVLVRSPVAGPLTSSMVSWLSHLVPLAFMWTSEHRGAVVIHHPGADEVGCNAQVIVHRADGPQ